MPWKSFLELEELLAEDVNTYLMGQAVTTHANVAARSAAILAPTTGQVSYLQDTQRLEIYWSSTWRTPWQFPRGLVTPGVHTPANFTFSTTLTVCALQAYNLSKNRLYMVHGTCTVNSQTLSGIVDTLHFGNSSATPLQSFQVTPANTSGLYGVAFQQPYLPTVDVSYGLRIYAQASGGGATTQTVQDIRLWVIDHGPNGNP